MTEWAHPLGADALSGERRTDAFWLRSRNWDRIFITGGALLVPVPILFFYFLRSLDLSVGTCEDLTTLLIMVTVGGPHVFATYTRTFLEPTFPRRERLLFFGAIVLMAIVIGSAIASTFFHAAINGYPLMQFVLTFFFFWAGVHVSHQNSYCAACYESGKPPPKDAPRWRKAWNVLDYLVILGCLYPIALFRMSMSQSGVGVETANPDALATKMVVALTGDPGFADGYVFRIGRTKPILPDFMLADAFWISASAMFFVVLILFLVKSAYEAKRGLLNRPRFTLVWLTAIVGFLVPVIPNLDTSFQGYNAWHAFQYLGILWLMNRRSYDRGEITSPFVKKLAQPGQHVRFYVTAFSVTIGLLLFMLLVGWTIEVASGGTYALFGHSAGALPIDPATGAPVYRPGSLLLAYYMIAFGLLLVHYLHDGVFFFRKRYLIATEPR